MEDFSTTQPYSLQVQQWNHKEIAWTGYCDALRQFRAVLHPKVPRYRCCLGPLVKGSRNNLQATFAKGPTQHPYLGPWKQFSAALHRGSKTTSLTWDLDKALLEILMKTNATLLYQFFSSEDRGLQCASPHCCLADNPQPCLQWTVASFTAIHSIAKKTQVCSVRFQYRPGSG